MDVVIVQLDIAWEDREANFSAVRRLLDRQPPPEGALVVLPEMFAAGFSMNVAGIHEGEDRPTERFLTATARAHGVTVVGGVVTRGEDGRGRNEALVVGPAGDVQARYTKLHPFRYGGEGDHYTPGETVTTFPWAGFVAAPFICYDLRFPEIYRQAAARGADLLITIANWPSARVEHWTTLLRARAIENQAYVVGVNRSGQDPHLPYPGRSLVVDPRGAVLVDAGADEGVFAAALSREDLTSYRAQLPFLRDMRPAWVGLDPSAS